MQRRSLLKFGLGAPLVLGGASCSQVSVQNSSGSVADYGLDTASLEVDADNGADSGLTGSVFVPGYWPDSAYFEGVPALKHKRLARNIPWFYNGSIRMLTRIGMDGDVAQALFPVHGHDVKISPDGTIGFFGNLEHDSYVCFDPDSLDLIARAKPVDRGWIGGGHGAFIQDGSLLALSERAPKVGYLGSAEAHFGRITLRNPRTLKVEESYSTHGISPHDVALMDDGVHLAVANYGSTYPKGKNKYGVPRHIVEASVTVIDLRDGRLVTKYVSNSNANEIRHLCARDRQTVFAIQTELGLFGKDQAYQKNQGAAYEAELTATRSVSYLPAPPVRLNDGLEELGRREDIDLMRHGLSIEYEPEFKQVIATYPATHNVFVFDAESGRVVERIDCAALGLDYPCGIIPLKDPRYYAVTGYWKDLFIFERGTHRLASKLNHYTTFFGHSHIAAA